MGKMKKCKKCAIEIPKETKTCPQCHSKLSMAIWKKVLIVAAVLILLSFVFGEKSNPSTTKPTNGSITQTQQEEKPIILTAEELAKAFEENEIKANGLYKDKLTKITGKVKIMGEALGSTFVVLSSGKDFSITDVQCYFDDKNEITKIANINKGDIVTIVGKVDGKSINVSVEKCRFSK